MGILLVITFHT